MDRLLGNLDTGLLFVVSGPAGSGKTTILRRLTEEFSCVAQHLSYTTRAPRPTEVQDVDYHFVTREEFEEKIAKGEFLEYIELYGNYYGTCLETLKKLQNSGKHVVLVIDVQGAQKIRESGIKNHSIFIQPPSLDELKARLVHRRTESPEVINLRLSIAAKEIEALVNFDYLIINKDLNVSSQVFKSIFIAEEHRVMNKR